eukprot:6962359-Ditylum_brightwellii.AAC.1
MAKVTFNTLSQSSNKEGNKSDEQQITIEGDNSKEDGMEMVKEKLSSELNNDDKEEDSSKDNLSSSSLEEEDPITQEEEFKKPTKHTMAINVMAQKQNLLALHNTPPHDLGESKQQE